MSEQNKLTQHKYEAVIYSGSFGLGIRHLQICLINLAALTLFFVRTSMSVAVLAMIEPTSGNSRSVIIYDWDVKTQGIIKASFFFGYFIMQVPGGILATRFGGKPLIFSALLFNGLCCLAIPLTAKYGDWQAVCVARAVMGLTQACLVPSCHTLLGKWIPPQERARLSNIAYCGCTIGTILSMPVCGILAETALGWPAIFYAMGGLSLLVAIVWVFLSESSPRQHRFISKGELFYIENSLDTPESKLPLPIPWKDIFTSSHVYAIIITQAGVTWLYLVLMNELPTYFKICFSINLKESALFSTLPFVSIWIMQILSGYLSEAIYNRKIVSVTFSRKLFNSIGFADDDDYLMPVILLGCVGGAAGFIAIIFVTKNQKILAVIILCMSSALKSCSGSGYMLNHIDLSPNFGGVLISLANCFSNFIGMLEPITSSFILQEKFDDFTRWQYIFITGSVIAIVGNVVFVLLATADKQQWDNPKLHDEDTNGTEKLNSI